MNEERKQDPVSYDKLIQTVNALESLAGSVNYTISVLKHDLHRAWIDKRSRHHKCFICGEPADLQLEDGQWECDNCSDIAAEFSMEQERENKD
jgi:ribosomal protein L37AE/L43A